MGRCALHTTRSLAVSHATSAASPVSTSSCCINGWRGRPRGRFHCGLLSGRWPVLALTARCNAMWAGVTSGSHLMWPNIAWRRLVILSRTLSWPVRFMMVALVTKSYQRIPSIRRWHDMLNASSFCSSDFSTQQCPGLCTMQKDRDEGIVQPQLCAQCYGAAK